LASAFSHAAAAIGLAACFYNSRVPKQVWVIGTVCSVLPDVDVIGFQYGVRYGDFWGHRGFTHSLVFAAILASVIVLSAFRGAVPGMSHPALWFYLFLATASHGFLDAFTDGGLGVAFFSPFDNHRYFFPWRPIRVSPIGVSHFFTARSLAVLRSELLWIWLPSVVIAALAHIFRRRHTVSQP
jgi:inner membrane protein